MTDAKLKKKTTATPEQRTAANPGLSVWVSANAGSGKTHVLVERVIRLLLAGADPASLLCITYTKAAAAEMAKRLFDRLSAWTAMSDAELAATLNDMGADGRDPALQALARQLFTKALETPGGLKIQTIHAFCERLLHLFPVEAGIAPGFRVMDDRETREMQESATRHVLRVAESGAEPEWAASFSRLADRLNPEQFEDLIGDCVETLRKGSGVRLRRADYEMALRHAMALADPLTLLEAEASLQDIDRAAYAAHAAQLKPYMTATNKVAQELLDIAKAEKPRGPLLDFYLTQKGELRKELLLKKAREEQPESERFLREEQTRIWDALTLCNTLQTIEASADAFVLASAILARIESEKRETGRYDFSDLISRTARLLSARRQTQWVLFKLDPGLAHILLDEAQDTGPDQWVMIHALAEEFFSGDGQVERGKRTLFVVGDQKQSIYSFQGADVTAYGKARGQLVTNERLQDVELSISYRSTEEVLKAVDDVFTPGERHHTVSDARKNDRGLVTLWPLVEPDEKVDEEPWTAPVDRPPQSSAPRRLAAAIGAEVATWLDGKRPRRLSGSDREVGAGDILILFRSRGPLFRMVLSELRMRGVPVAGADRLNLLKSLIVQDLQMLLSWLLLPEDDLALATLLKSPLVPKPLTEAELFALAHDREASIFARLTSENRTWLEMLQKLAATETPFAVLSRVLAVSRRAIQARLGSEAIEASDAMLDLALDHEREHGPSLFGFLRWFASTETTIRRELDQAAGEVRLMTVHGAKGLEAPVVIIADATAAAAGSNSRPKVIAAPDDALIPGLPVWLPSGLEPRSSELDRWLGKDDDRLKAESGRLLYVAMTRAADELHVFAQRPRTKEPTWWTALTEGLGEPEGDQPLRRGPDDAYAGGKAGRSTAKPVIPSWMIKVAFSEQLAASLALTKAMAGVKSYDAVAAKRGRAVHKLLEELADLATEPRGAYAKLRAAKLGLQDADASRLVDALSVPALQPFLGAESRGEVDIAGELPDGREVSGRIDRLAVTAEGIWLLDYKTDRHPPAFTLSSHPYAQQLSGYAALLQAAYPGRPHHVAIFWTETARVEILSEAILTAALQGSDDGKP